MNDVRPSKEIVISYLKKKKKRTFLFFKLLLGFVSLLYKTLVNCNMYFYTHLIKYGK